MTVREMDAVEFMAGPVKSRIKEAIESAYLVGIADFAYDASISDADRERKADDWQERCLECMRRLMSAAGTIYVTAGEDAAVRYLDAILPIVARVGRTEH